MKIVHYLSEIVLAHGGVVRAVLDLCDALARAEHEVHLMCFDDTDVPEIWRRGPATPGLRPRSTRLDWPRGPKPLRQFSKADLLRAEAVIAGARVVHLHGPWEATNLQIAAIARARSIPYLISTHGMLDDWTISKGKLKKRLFLALRGRRLLDEAACVLCTASAERTQARKWFKNPRVEVLPLLFDLEALDSQASDNARVAEELIARSAPAGSTGPIVLFLSRIHPKKGLEVLIEAARLLRSSAPPFRVVIAGKEDHMVPGYEQTLRKLSADSGVADLVSFVGMVVGAEKTALLRAARVSVLPTSQENWGFSLLESLACATPVITTRGVDIWPELESSGGAIIIDQDPKALAQAIQGLLTDEDRARAMGARGEQWVRKELDRATVVRLYEDLYRAISS